MKKGLTCGLFWSSFWVALSAQTFNKRYDPYGLDLYGFAFSVEIIDPGSQLIVFYNAGWQDTIYYSSVLGTLLLSDAGLPLDTTEYFVPLNATYNGWSDASFKRANGSYVVGGSIRGQDEIHYPAVFFFSAQGNPDSLFAMSELDGWIGRHTVETFNGNYLLCGERSNGNDLDGFLIKLSPTGNTLWTWSGGGGSADYATSVGESSDSKYYMGGAKEFSSSNIDFWVKAFDTSGQPLWDTIWGSPYLESVAYVRIASDGGLLVAGGFGISAGNNKVKYIAKLNHEDGSPIWERFYGPGGYDGALLSLKELPSGDLIGTGTHVLGVVDYTGVLLRTTSEGDSLWMRYYYYEDSITTNGRGIFRDVEPTPDGGFVAVGSAFSDANYSQDVWVVKVDQHGCIEPGCHLITGMETQITNMRDVLRVWPNPVHAEGQVQVQLVLPETFVPQGDLRITVTSSDGRLVHEEAVYNSSTTSTLQLPQLTPGLYHIHLCDASRWISGAKLVVE